VRKRLLPHLVLIFFLLLAQQAGFLHALSHLWPAEALRAQELSRRSNAPGPEKAPHRTQACVQCLALTLSDGVVDVWIPVDAVGATGAPPAVSLVAGPSRTASFPFLARAPPAVA
jgi:hypothetical protein